MSSIEELLKKEPFDIDNFLSVTEREELIEDEEERALVMQAQQHDCAAVERLTGTKARYIVAVADQYKTNGLPMQKLIQAGVRGFKQAIGEYDASSDEKFMRSAVPLIRKSIEEAVWKHIRERQGKEIFGLMRCSSIIPLMNEYLEKEPFDIDDFIKTAIDADNLICDKEDFLVDSLQNSEWSHCNVVSHLKDGESYGEFIAKTRESGKEINKLRWLYARNVLSIAREFESAGREIQKLLVAGMQGVKNAAMAYNFNPRESFTDYAASVIRKHIEFYTRTGEQECLQLANEYMEIHAKAADAYSQYCSAHSRMRKLLHKNGEKQRASLLANAKINRCRKEVINTADNAVWYMANLLINLPGDYNEGEVLVHTRPYTLHDALYSGECNGLAKSVDGEWCICTAPEGKRIAISGLTDRESLFNTLEALYEKLENLSNIELLPFREWRVAKGL